MGCDYNIELDLRNIKTTLGMEMLSCKTPAMAQKEIWVYLLAYNLIRLMMAQSALLADRLPRQLSFKHTLQIWIAWDHHGTNHDDKLYGLFFLIAQQQVGDRPGRIEPRAIKRRPKPFPLLTEPREIAREKVRKHGHPEKLTNKSLNLDYTSIVADLIQPCSSMMICSLNYRLLSKA